MTKTCENCNYSNNDSYLYCAKCGHPLEDGLPQRNFFILKSTDTEERINLNLIIISYLVTIFLSWSGFIIGLLFKNTRLGVFTFFGFFMPFYLIQSHSSKIRYHGIIQLMISIIGVLLSLYVILH